MGKGELLATAGIPALDEAWGGMRRGNVVNVLSEACGGGTAFANILVNRLLSAGKRVLVWSKMESSQKSSRDENLMFVNARFDAQDFVGVLRRVYYTDGFKYDAVVIDCIAPPSDMDSPYMAVEEAFRQVKEFAKYGLDSEVCVITTFQFGRLSDDCEEREVATQIAQCIKYTDVCSHVADDTVAVWANKVQKDDGFTKLYHVRTNSGNTTGDPIRLDSHDGIMVYVGEQV